MGGKGSPVPVNPFSCIGRLRELEDPLQQFDFLLELGAGFGRTPEIETDEFRIDGCKAGIWAKADGPDLWLSANSMLVLGVLAIVHGLHIAYRGEEADDNALGFLMLISDEVIYPEIKSNGIRKVWQLARERRR